MAVKLSLRTEPVNCLKPIWPGGFTVPDTDFPQIESTTKAGLTFKLIWLALRTRSYQLQFTTNLTQPNWTNSGNPIAATNTAASASDTITSADRQGFYRVALLPEKRNRKIEGRKTNFRI